MAEIMKLDTKKDQLWRDKALVELNVAVLHSYNVRYIALLNYLLIHIHCTYIHIYIIYLHTCTLVHVPTFHVLSSIRLVVCQ